jgi:hypothetical protein
MRILMAAAASLAFIAAPASAAQLLTNGNFETGSYAGWTALAAPSANGSIQLSTPGTGTPQNSFPTPANAAGGNFYSVTDQGGPGAYALLQTFTVAPGTTSLTLSFQQFVQTNAAFAVGLPDLNFVGPANQHARVDILTASSGAFSTSSIDVVANFYLGIDGAIGSTPYTAYSFNISSLAAGTYQLRFAQVDNQGNFNQGVDNVSIEAVSGAVPEPASWAMMIVGFGIVGVSARRRAAVRAVIA